MKATCSSEMSVDFQRTTCCYIPEDNTLHNHSCEDLKPYKTIHVLLQNCTLIHLHYMFWFTGIIETGKCLLPSTKSQSINHCWVHTIWIKFKENEQEIHIPLEGEEDLLLSLRVSYSVMLSVSRLYSVKE
jgi:hypothetical protein